MNLMPNITLVIQMVTFLVLMVILDRLLFKPMMRVLNERKARTEGRRQIAADAEAEAGNIWESYEKDIIEAKASADLARVEVIRTAEAKRQAITAVATAESDKVLAEIRARVQADADVARDAVQAQVAGLAQEMAQKVLGRAI